MATWVVGGAGTGGAVDAGAVAEGETDSAAGATGGVGASGDGVGAEVCPATMAGAATATGNTVTGGRGRTGAVCTGTGVAGNCGVPTITSCGDGPTALTCSCRVVPGGRVWGNCAVMTMSPILSATMPSAVLPMTIASSTCPGLNGTTAAAADATTFGSWGWIDVTIRRACRIRVNAR